jgi:hypothetical protein
MPMNVTCDVSENAKGVYRDRRFSGEFESFMRYHEFGIHLTLSGTFEVKLS